MLVYVRAVDDDQIDDAMEAGAAGFLSKEVDGVAMVVALDGVAASRKVLAVPTPDEASRAMWPGEREGLSTRESVIVALIVAGMSDQDIASSLYVSSSSVGPSIRSVYRKMGVANRVQAVLWGIDRGFEIARHRPTQQWQRPVSPCALESA